MGVIFKGYFVLIFIINQSLTFGIFPNSLKISKVNPVFKNENNNIITIYRPISVSSVISKIFETVIVNN